MKSNSQERTIVPTWLKLDNAANIYPALMTRKFVPLFRFTITLSERVDATTLTQALKNIIKRVPTFGCRLKQGLFWYYFEHIDGIPGVEEDVCNPLAPFILKNNKYFMFRVRYFDRSIAIEIFHALTDGTGGQVFLLTLVAEYLKIKYKCKIPYTDKILDPNQAPSATEYEDSFQKYARNVGQMERGRRAYHVPGTVIENHLLNIITGTIPLDKLIQVADEYNCTITEFLASIMILAIQQIQEEYSPRKKCSQPIKISIPVNLRQFYPSRTLRNFSSYINVGIDSQLGHFTLQEIVSHVKNYMALMKTEKQQNIRITGNVRAERSLFFRFVPMFLKRIVLSIGAKLMGDRYCSHTLSNLGNLILPDEMAKYVTDVCFILGRSLGKPASCGCISYNGNLVITFSRRIKESELERLFFTKLIDMGIPVEIKSNKRW